MASSKQVESAAEALELSRSKWKLERRAEYWRSSEGCTLIAGFVRDGLKPADIAKAIGVSPSTFVNWLTKYDEIAAAVKEGSELNDYKVENALLRSALGHKAKNVTVTSTYRYGKLVETQRIEEEVEVEPNIAAIKTWLYNRRPGTWLPESKIAAEDDGSDSAIQVEITNAIIESSDEVGSNLSEGRKQLADELGELKEEYASSDPGGLDYWPEDWEDDDEDQ